MRGTLQEVADHLGVTTSAAYKRARDATDVAVRQVKRGTYEADDDARGAGTASPRGSRAASLPSVAPEPERAPITRFGFSLVIDVEVPVDTPDLRGLAERLVSGLPTVPGVTETGRRHTSFLPRRGRTPVPQSAGDEQEEQ